MRSNLVKTLERTSSKKRASTNKSDATAERKKILSQLTNIQNGVGWSSDKMLARYFDVSRQRIWQWSKEGKLPKPHKHGEATTRWLNKEVLEAEGKHFFTEG